MNEETSDFQCVLLVRSVDRSELQAKNRQASVQP